MASYFKICQLQAVVAVLLIVIDYRINAELVFTVANGDTVILPCSADAESQVGLVSWKCYTQRSRLDSGDGKVVSQNGNVYIAFKSRFTHAANGSLIISNLQTADAGFYECLGNNGGERLIVVHLEVGDPSERKLTTPKPVAAQCRRRAFSHQQKLQQTIPAAVPRETLVEAAKQDRQLPTDMILIYMSEQFSWNAEEQQYHLQRLRDIRAGQISEIQLLSGLVAAHADDPSRLLKELQHHIKSIKPEKGINL